MRKGNERTYSTHTLSVCILIPPVDGDIEEGGGCPEISLFLPTSQPAIYAQQQLIIYACQLVFWSVYYKYQKAVVPMRIIFY